MSAVGTPIGSLLSDQDLYLFNEGTHRHLGERLGAHPSSGGTWFGVWAPNATGVGVVGDFNGWDPTRHALARRSSSGIWEGLVANAQIGDIYKFAITTQQGNTLTKADPFARCAEAPPLTGSVIWDLTYEWHDNEWLRTRGERISLGSPISVYEVHLGSWLRR
jgi:1,4-alpha-glucan branching enzyme